MTGRGDEAGPGTPSASDSGWGAPRAAGPGWSLAGRITLLSVGVALVASILGGVATARWVLAEERAAVTQVLREGTASTTQLERLRAARETRPGKRVVRAVVVSVGVGLLVGLLAGGAAAQLMTGPLRRTAGAARSLAAGRRDVRLDEDGPPEVADVAAGLNALAAALADSEDRQRRFLLSVSHELRTPLTAVRGYAESIADGVVTGDDARAAGQVVLAESQRLDRLVQDLLDLARLGADDFRLDLVDTDLHRLLDEAVQVWTTRASARDVRLVVERPVGPLVVRTDPARVRQVLDGLAENALRMTPAGGVLVLAAAAANGPARAVLAVRDSGPGLSDDDLAVAFTPGALGARYRDQRPVGVGIGLSLVHGLVSRLGGTIVAGRAAEGGAEFTVTLP